LAKKQPESKINNVKGASALAEAPPEVEVEVKKEEPKFQMNDYMEKAMKPVPQDPDGNETMHAGLIISAEAITEILEQTMAKNLTWLLAEK
jgi:hypothetical protein